MQPNPIQTNKSLITPFFKSIAVHDEIASKREGRPIFRDEEFVEVRIAGDRNFAPCFPAHQMWKREEGEEVSYAERWPDQYRRFKENQVQVAEGTPLEELPFLTNAKRAELKALKVYTAEALASLEGKNLKNLGMEGRKLKDQATAYLQNAAGSASVVALAEEIRLLKERLSQYEAGGREEVVDQEPAEVEVEQDYTDSQPSLESLSDDQLKQLIRDETGSGLRGQPSRETLLAKAAELGIQAA